MLQLPRNLNNLKIQGKKSLYILKVLAKYIKNTSLKQVYLLSCGIQAKKVWNIIQSQLKEFWTGLGPNAAKKGAY